MHGFTFSIFRRFAFEIYILDLRVQSFGIEYKFVSLVCDSSVSLSFFSLCGADHFQEFMLHRYNLTDSDLLCVHAFLPKRKKNTTWLISRDHVKFTKVFLFIKKDYILSVTLFFWLNWVCVHMKVFSPKLVVLHRVGQTIGDPFFRRVYSPSRRMRHTCTSPLYLYD